MLTWEYVEGNILRENIWLAEEKKNGEGKGGKHLEKENICFAEGKKNGEGKGGKNHGQGKIGAMYGRKSKAL